MIFCTDKSVTLLGAGSVSIGDIEEILPTAPIVLAADGGAGRALEAGLMPEAVIGDFDSLPQFAKTGIPADRFHRIDEQDSTDFEKCLREIASPLIFALGFTGGRADHELAVYNALARFPAKRCLVVGSEDIVFHAPPHLMLDLPTGSRLSLFPMARVVGQSKGLRWPIDGLDFAPDRRVGTSNQVTGAVELSFPDPGMLVIIPRAALRAARAALLAG